MPTQLPRVRYAHSRLCVCQKCELLRVLENQGHVIAIDPSESAPQPVADEMDMLNRWTSGDKSDEVKRREAREKLIADQRQVGQDRRLDDSIEANRARAKAKFESLGRPQSGR